MLGVKPKSKSVQANGDRKPSASEQETMQMPPILGVPAHDDGDLTDPLSHLDDGVEDIITKNGLHFNSWEQSLIQESGMEVKDYDQYIQWRIDGQEFFDDPHSSIGANFFSSLVLVCILISTVTLCIETLEEYKDDTSVRNLFIVETLCVAVFTIEYGARIGFAFGRCGFALEVMNIIDLVAIVPYYITLFLQFVLNKSTQELSSFAVLRLIRLVRVFRILKLARNMPTLKLIVMAVIESFSSLVLMCFILLVMLIVFGAFEFFFEMGTTGYCNDFAHKDNQDSCVGTFLRDGVNTSRVWYEDPYNRLRCGVGYNGLPSDPDNCSLSPYYSIPQAMWWCLVTLLTVGYGDLYPITIGGKIVAALAMTVSVVILALPISIIGTNFVDFWAIEEARSVRKEDPQLLATSAKTTRQSLGLFVQTIKFNIDKSDVLKRSILRLISEMGPRTNEERKREPGPHRQAMLYRLKASEQLLYVLRTKNLRLLPLEDADTMVRQAKSDMDSRVRSSTPRVETRDDAATKLSHDALHLLTKWKEDRPDASILKVLDRSRGNAHWFALMQQEHRQLVKELSAMRKIIGVEPGQYKAADGGDED